MIDGCGIASKETDHQKSLYESDVTLDLDPVSRQNQTHHYQRVVIVVFIAQCVKTAMCVYTYIHIYNYNMV